jgi:hypothetical protein
MYPLINTVVLSNFPICTWYQASSHLVLIIMIQSPFRLSMLLALYVYYLQMSFNPAATLMFWVQFLVGAKFWAYVNKILLSVSYQSTGLRLTQGFSLMSYGVAV